MREAKTTGTTSYLSSQDRDGVHRCSRAHRRFWQVMQSQKRTFACPLQCPDFQLLVGRAWRGEISITVKVRDQKYWRLRYPASECQSCTDSPGALRQGSILQLFMLPAFIQITLASQQLYSGQCCGLCLLRCGYSRCT